MTLNQSKFSESMENLPQLTRDHLILAAVGFIALHFAISHALVKRNRVNQFDSYLIADEYSMSV